MQVCTKCLTEKPFSGFEFRKDTNAYRKICRECEKPSRNARAAKRRSTLEGKYKMQIQNATARGIPFLLSFEQWLLIWSQSGKLNERGRGANKYCMCRYGDIGAYEIGNVFIGTGKENVRDGNLGKVMTQEVKNKISKANAGKPHDWSKGDKNPMHRPEVKAKISAAISGSNHYNARGVITPNGFFETAKDAAKVLGISKSTIEWRAKHNKFGFSRPNLAIA
jgi:hypothetical protein